MMNSAFFGQLIILIVFIPILTLTGVEGKMFKPMAMTFSFAVIGAMILCLTYVPMVSSLFMNNKINLKLSFGLENIYVKILSWVLNKTKWVLGVALLSMISAVLVFGKMGGEFIPNLDEVDLALHALLKPGSSLEESVKATSAIENILLENFPEVKQVIARIGVSEIPIDPMPMDVADVFVLLKPRNEWVSASSREELVDKFKHKLAVLPGVNFEFTQPVQIRFNELLTGVRQGVAVKLYRESLEVLRQKADEIGKIIQTVEGVGDMKIEATQGLPQMSVRYQRDRIAQYGLSIEELNTVVRMAFGGQTAGVVFEGEKRFDLVLRLQESHRTGITDLRNIFVPLADGSQIPLREVAEIDYQPGLMQVSRENTNRRIYVGVNVRGRDV
jgi:cobalt-zinc-cadmium resistance protein CzcA